MRSDEPIFELRRTVQRLMEEFSVLAAETSNVDENRALDRVSMELDDVDRSLYDAVFIRNDTRIEELIREVKAASSHAEGVRRQLLDLREAISSARDVIAKSAKKITNLDKALGEAEGILAMIKV